MALQLETLKEINQELSLYSDYKIHIEHLVSNTYCVCIRNSIHEGYYDRPIRRSQLKTLLDSVDDIKEFHYLLRLYAKDIINL